MRKYFFNALLLCVTLFLCFSALEVWLRYFNRVDFRINRGEIVLPINRVYDIKNTLHARGIEPFIHHTKNSLGFRGPGPDSRQGRFSIIAVGGSTTECFYLSDGKDWPALLAGKLHARGIDIWMNNAGMDGHSSFGHYILLRDHIAPLHPNMVLILVGLNDIQRSDLNRYETLFLHKGVIFSSPYAFVRSLLREAELRSKLVEFLMNVYRVAKARRMGVNHQAIDPSQEPQYVVSPREASQMLSGHEPYVQGYAVRLRRLVDLCHEQRITPVLLTQPALYGVATDPATGADLGRMRVCENSNGAVQWHVLEKYNQATRDVATETGTGYVDLARLLPKDSAYFYDLYHFSVAGAEAVAGILARALPPILAEAGCRARP